MNHDETALRAQLDTISQSGRGDDIIGRDIGDLLRGYGVDYDLADRLARDLTDSGYQQAMRWTAVGMITNVHHLALDAAVIAVRFAAGAVARSAALVGAV